MDAGQHSKKPLPLIDQKRAQASIKRLMDIYREMSTIADEVSLMRCPYKDAKSRCTASFNCQNQYFLPDRPEEDAVCTGSDKIDYSKAWQF